MNKSAFIRNLIGLTITNIDGQAESDIVNIETACGRKFIMEHHQDCCEQVKVYDIKGELNNIIGNVIINAIEDIDDESWPDNVPGKENSYNFTWTTYCLETEKGKFQIRWLGKSNGYYGEEVAFEEIVTENNND